MSSRFAPLPTRKTAIDEVVADAEALPARGQEYRIQGNEGLVLFVLPSGTATWFFRYTDTRVMPPRQVRRKIGRLKFMTIDKAVAEAAVLRQRIAAGEDLNLEAAARKTGMTLRQLFDVRMAKDDARAQSTLIDYKRTLEQDVFPVLGDRPAGAITSDEIESVLEVVERRSRHVAHRARSALGSTFRWAMKRKASTGVRSNPTVGMGFTVKSKPRTNVVSAAQLRTLWLGMDRVDASISESVRTIMRLCILTGQRRAEVTCATISELRLDDERSLWQIPAARMKRKDRDQVVPLSREATKLFRCAVGNRTEGFVFPADLKRVAKFAKPQFGHIAPLSISTAMRRLTSLINTDKTVGAVKVGDTHIHDMRKVLATWLSEQRYRSDVLDAILHHAPRGVTGSHYNFAVLEEPVREALQAWADHVTRATQVVDEGMKTPKLKTSTVS
jgi:integrase